MVGDGLKVGQQVTLFFFKKIILLGISHVSEKATGFHELSKTYGDVFGLWMGPNRSIVVSGFAKVQEVGARWIRIIFRQFSMKN